MSTFCTCGLTLGAADEQIGQCYGAGSNSYRSSAMQTLERLAADPWALCGQRAIDRLRTLPCTGSAACPDIARCLVSEGSRTGRPYQRCKSVLPAAAFTGSVTLAL